MMEGQCWYEDSILAASGFSEVQMNTMYNVTENTETDASADILNLISPPTTEPLIDLFEGKNYDNSVERSGPPFNGPQESSGSGGLDNFMLSQLMPKEEPISFMDIKLQQAESSAFPVQYVNMNNAHEFQSKVKEETDASDVAPNPVKIMSRKIRERSKEADSHRRSLISQRVKALQNLLPPTLKDKPRKQESIVHDVISRIKYLQLQVKELSRNRLGGDSSSDPLKFAEGYGHYRPHEEVYGESLEDLFGSLLEENPAAARKLLDSQGLFIVPMASIDALLSNKG